MNQIILKNRSFVQSVLPLAASHLKLNFVPALGLGIA